MKKVFASLLIATMATASFAADVMNVGDLAPALKVAKWVKGKPLPENLKDGKVKVVEFWATWCGPCKVTIPHLTELAKKYQGKVDFVGVSVWETKQDRNSKTDFTYLPVVEKFVQEWGDKMDYNVAVDGPEGTMAETWMQAAGERGIPSAFVVNEEGRIVFIGHPMDDNFEKAIAGTLDKSWDWKAESSRRLKEIEAEKKRSEAMAAVSALEKEKKYGEALAKIEEIAKSDPQMEPALGAARYRILKAHDQSAINPMLRAELGKDQPNINLIYTGVLDILNDGSGLKERDYNLAVAIVEKMDKTIPNNLTIHMVMGDAYAKKGDWDKAISATTRAIEIAQKAEGTNPQQIERLKAKLEDFKSKKANGGSN